MPALARLHTLVLQGGVWNEKYPSCLVCPKELSREAAEQVFVCPLAAELWRRYGTELFWSGHALYELRHLLALVQRLYPSVRLALGPA